MKFKIPFTISDVNKQRKRSQFFKKFIKAKKSRLQFYLGNSETGLTREDYISICLRNFIFAFFILLLISTTLFILLKVPWAVLLAILFSVLFAAFVFFSQMSYPRVFNSRRQKNIEKNLITALEDMLIQLNSGIPLFTIMVNISDSDYGEFSSEIKKAVRKINAGLPESEVLEDLGEKNSSNFFRRTLWQISNGLRSGSDLSIVIRNSIKSLSEEQLIQIQNYGNKLNPLIVFYMLVSIILPALSITFLTVIASLINLSSAVTMGLFMGLFAFVTIIQVMFLGMVKSIRPRLL